MAGAPKSVLVGMRRLRKWAGFLNRESMLDYRGTIRHRAPVVRHLDRFRFRRQERGNSDLKYWTLQALQEITGVPVGIQLVSSHVLALAEDGRTQEIAGYADGLRALASQIDTLLAAPIEAQTSEQQRAMLESLYFVWQSHGVDFRHRPAETG